LTVIGLADAHRALLEGELEISGRIMPASNATFYAEAVLRADPELRVPCVYKPVAGERPLWDFPDGTLASREVAAYVVSQALGWNVVPLTLLREGPAGLGMVQLWCEPDDGIEAVDLVPAGHTPPGWLHVLDARDGAGHAVSLVHEDSPALRRMAVFDVLINNADRKGGHVLAMADGHRYGVDHGVCFHVENKLRTVLWGWARRSLAVDDRRDVVRLRDELAEGAPLHLLLAELLSEEEVLAFRQRLRRLLDRGRLPSPSGSWPSIPWPAF
jgi:uncharacterized repeat protein (TIGR03843 family)